MFNCIISHVFFFIDCLRFHAACKLRVRIFLEIKSWQLDFLLLRLKRFITHPSSFILPKNTSSCHEFELLWHTDYDFIWHVNESNIQRIYIQAWAVYKGKYREGKDKADPTMWKTRLRCALNKSTDFQEVPERNQLDITEPYKVYRIQRDNGLARTAGEFSFLFSGMF